MEKQFDIAIIGNNLPSAISAYKAIKAGLQVALINQNADKDNLGDNSFIVFKQKLVTKPIEYIKQVKLINLLKRIASHLLLTTEIEEYKKLSLFSVFIVHLNNFFSNRQIKLAKIPGKRRFYKLNYQSYKISKNRLVVVVLKTIDNPDFKLYNGKKADIKKNKEEFIVHIGRKIIKASNVLSFYSENKPTSFSNASFFATYSNDILKLEKTLIWESKDILIKIIPWFNYVYFELSGSSLTNNSIDEILEIIKDKFSFIEFDRKKILASGILENINDTETFHTKKSSNIVFKTKSPTLTEYFSLSNKVISKISNQKKLINDVVLIGSDFKIPYHPLRIMEYCDEKYDEAKHILQSPQYFKKLFYRYGTEIDKITYQAYEYWNKTKDIKKTWLKAEIWYVVNYERCKTACEFINKHTEEWMNGKNTDNKLIENLFEELASEK